LLSKRVLMLVEPIERAKQIVEYLVTLPVTDTFSSKEKEFLQSVKFKSALQGAIIYFDKHGFEDKAS